MWGEDEVDMLDIKLGLVSGKQTGKEHQNSAPNKKTPGDGETRPEAGTRFQRSGRICLSGRMRVQPPRPQVHRGGRLRSLSATPIRLENSQSGAASSAGLATG